MLKRVPIRWRLAAAFAVSMAALLLALGAFVYLRVEGALRSSVDQALRAQSAESIGHREEGSLLDSDARESGTIAQVVGPDGQVVRSDPVTLPALLGPSEAATARHGAVLTTVSLGEGELNRWRVLAVPDGEHVLVMARPLRQTEETLHRLFGGLLVAGPIGLLLATLGGYLLAAAALRPVESMRRRASAISATTPGARLPVPPSRDEIRELAETLNEMLARLEAALEHERRFVADASHELRTPLALLKAELELALRRPRTAEELRAAVGSAAEETDRLVVLAEDLLLIARSDQEALGLRLEPVDLGALARSTADRFAERASKDNRRVDVEIPPRTEVSADRLRLEQALRNLVDNALGYGDGKVTITTRDVGDAVEIHVLDEGEGFPPEVAARAFERFTRGDDARTRGGSGLGLAIVEAVAQAHGGSAGIARNGNGADVWISLPGHTVF
ncbi:MAG TPA: ATP-binding protein [Gaiella sp.]|nr:ATP-binding protein [Gaiella sp.]